jgi:folylpolyglutamate synthase/dihydropteroate synthase
MLSDKDAAGAIAALAPVLEGVVCTEIPAETLHSQGRPGAAAHSAADLAAMSRAQGLEAEAEPRLDEALARARQRASASQGTLLVTGSHYLLAPARAGLAK